MTSYRGAGGAWDGGPPGAEAEYATHTQQPQAPPYPALASSHTSHQTMPTTDPWTGVSYTQYGAPASYDYQAYGATGYSYNYNTNYYQQPDTYYGKYPDAQSAYPSGGYDYSHTQQERSRSPVESKSYDRGKSYRSKSRSKSPYKQKERAYSRKRENSYDEQTRPRSRSVSLKSKHAKYSSSDRSSSRSRSYSRSSSRKDKKKKRVSASSESSRSDRSYRNKSDDSVDRVCDRSLTPPLKNISRSHNRPKSHSISNDRSYSRSPKIKIKQEKDEVKRKDVKSKAKKHREVTTPPRKHLEATPPPKGHKKTKKSKNKQESSLTPPRSYKYKERKSKTPPQKTRDSSLTPPRSYARSQTSSSKSRSRSSTPKRLKQKRSPTPKSHRSKSSSSQSSDSSVQSDSKSKRKGRRRSVSKSRSRSQSHSRRPSKSRGKGKRSNTPKRSNSRSRSRSPRSRSHSGTPSEDERRGQFTVADRKRFWKLHRSRQDERVKTPPKEVKPPPGAIESSTLDDIEYGDPPEVEGPNFAELLPPPDQIAAQASTSRSKSIPIPIKNDGSFLEMFKKMQEQTKKAEVEKKPEIKKPLPFIGKRRGGRVLKTGLVKKAKAIDEQTVDNTPKDAWSLYMQEVKKYRETSCEEERKTRPLVK